MSSTRLPGKVLMPILGKPMLQHQIERTLRSKKIDKLVIATSNEKEDNQIEILCKLIGVEIFRGSLDNVLDRFYKATLKYSPICIVRLTGDCPLTDPYYIDQVIDFYLTENCDFVNNCDPPTLPDGLDVGVFSFAALKEAWLNAKLPSEIEHVTPYIKKKPEKFKLSSWQNTHDLSHLRWTVDEPEDFEFVKKVYEHLYPSNPEFNTKDVLTLLEKMPTLMKINAHFIRNEGMKKSLCCDKKI